jgi:hypothetical protein
VSDSNASKCNVSNEWLNVRKLISTRGGVPYMADSHITRQTPKIEVAENIGNQPETLVYVKVRSLATVAFT